jgi:predicted TPR repeat methyltransferase
MAKQPPGAGQPTSATPGGVRALELNALLLQAKTGFDARDYGRTVRACQEVLRHDPRHTGALLMLGRTAQRTGSNSVAASFFQRLLDADPRHVPARIALGDCLLAEQRPDGAAAHYRRAIELQPRSAEAHCSLGTALLAQGERDKALSSFHRAKAIDPAHKLAGYMVAGLSGPGHAPAPAYVKQAFDDYAPTFEQHLVSRLGYRMPWLLAQGLAERHPAPFAAALDLGCGTGLCADALGPSRVAAIDGVDLAPRMIEIARAKGKYRALFEAELVEFLNRPESRSAGYDLVLSADVFIYVGELRDSFAGIAGIVAPGGLLALSVEHTENPGFELQVSTRYAHSVDYIAGLAQEFGFAPLLSRNAVLRRENGVDIMGRMDILERIGTPQAG